MKYAVCGRGLTYAALDKPYIRYSSFKMPEIRGKLAVHCILLSYPIFSTVSYVQHVCLTRSDAVVEKPVFLEDTKVSETIINKQYLGRNATKLGDIASVATVIFKND